MTHIKLTGIRLPTVGERKNGAEIVFDYKVGTRKETIYGATCYESWQQWGAPREVLSANCDTIEAWRRDELEGFPCVVEDPRYGQL